MSCLNALRWQITTLFSVPEEILLLRHKVFREYAKIAVGPDFIHTLPTILLLTAAIVILWNHPPSYKRLVHLLRVTFVYRSLQVLVSWITISALLWLWLIFQRVLYCNVWQYWSYEFEHREIQYRAWWQRLWSSYYPSHMHPSVVSTEFISWIISMSMTVTALGFAVYMDSVAAFIKKILTKVRNVLEAVFYYVKLPWEGVNTEGNMAIEDSEISWISDDIPSKMSVYTNDPTPANEHPAAYQTNRMPQPKFATFKEAHRKISTKSFHTVAGVNDIQDSDKIAAKQTRHRRSCHTVIPSNSSEQSSEH